MREHLSSLRRQQVTLTRVALQVTPRSWFVASLLVVLIANLLPIWEGPYLPLQDFGGHIQLLDIMGRFHSPETGYSSRYAITGWLNPNSLTHKVAWLFGPALAADTVARILLSWYIVFTPLALLAFARRLRLSSWTVFFGTATLYNTWVGMGFVDFLTAIPLFWFTLALAVRDKPAPRSRDILLAFCTVALFFAHAIVFSWGMGLASLALLRGPQRRRRLLALVPALALFAWWTVRKFLWNEQTAAGHSFVQSSGLGANYWPIEQRIRLFYENSFDLFHSTVDDWMIAVVLAAVVLLFLLQARGKWKGINFAHVVLGAGIVGYLTLPVDLAAVAIIAQRCSILILQALPLSVVRRRVRRLAFVPIIVAAAASVAYPIYVRSEFARFNADYIHDLPAAISRLPNRSRLYCVTLSNWRVTTDVTKSASILHTGKAFHALSNAGETNDSFTRNTTTAVNALSSSVAPELDWSVFWTDPQLDWYDYALAYSLTPPLPDGTPSRLALIRKIGNWYLYRVNKEVEANDMR